MLNLLTKCLVLLQRTQQTQLKPGFLFVLINPAELGKLGTKKTIIILPIFFSQACISFSRNSQV